MHNAQHAKALTVGGIVPLNMATCVSVCIDKILVCYRYQIGLFDSFHSDFQKSVYIFDAAIEFHCLRDLNIRYVMNRDTDEAFSQHTQTAFIFA